MSGLLEFGEFCQLAAKFLFEEDEKALKKELKEAFRIYDKEGKNREFPDSADLNTLRCGPQFLAIVDRVVVGVGAVGAFAPTVFEKYHNNT